MTNRSSTFSRLSLLAATAVTVLSINASSAQALQKNVLFVLDSSNSMWGQVDGVAKIDIAKQALVDLVAKMPKTTKMGLVAYGHRFNHKLNDCSDMELISGIGSTNNETIQEQLGYVKPNGQTPIANTLAEVGSWLQPHLEEDNTVVLISDGLESCDGDPCAASKALKDAGVTTAVHVVGFDLDTTQQASIQCIAENGDGQYFNAQNNEGLVEALEQVREVVEQQPVKPMKVAQAETKPAVMSDAVYYEDNFDSEELSGDWTIVNENPDNYLVEDGKLTVLFGDTGNGTEAYKTAANIFRLNKPIPKGDWTMTMRVMFVAQTHKEWLRMGITKDQDDSVLTSLEIVPYNYDITLFNARADKMAKGENTNFVSKITDYRSNNVTERTDLVSQSTTSTLLRLTKEGRNYISAVKLEAADGAGDKAPPSEWIELQKLTSLKLPGDAFTFFFGHGKAGFVPKDGEGLVEVDWVKIETN
ncbi:VWA domain-containing protein [uncultured Cohaesibacter sp.]|uniref:vWA domain-containing protein n=1 Tax=uncultured Cohaesibacter sp. TaxID=1002546 RepID=UPI0029C840AA|nr:VWA domain-containing protein [uncultured Cohaesibacter sp.]